MPIYAVLTGDIVKSSAMSSDTLDAIFARLQAVGDTIAEWQGAPTYFTRNRGDGWQMAVSAAFALRAVFAVKAAVRSVGKRCDTRVALAIGDGRIAGKTLADAEGVAFIQSGQALDVMKRRQTMVALPAGSTQAIVLRLAEEIIVKWTDAQAGVTLLALDPSGPTQTALAATLDVAQQTVQGHLDASGVDGLIEVCDLVDGA